MHAPNSNDTRLADGQLDRRRYEFHDFLPQPYSAKVEGVYAILNRNNGKIYIGSAVNLRHRWAAHRSDLAGRGHNSRYFQRAFDKDPGAFYIEIIEELPGADKARLLAREQFWLDFFKSYLPQNGYNLCPQAKSCQGIVRSEEYRRKCSAWKRKPWTAEQKGRLKLARPPSSYRRGWKWSAEVRKKLSDSHKGKVLPEPQRAKMRASLKAHPYQAKPVIQISPEGTEIKRFKTIIEAEAAFEGRRSNISLVCKGKRQFCFGFRWKYANK